MTQVIDAYGFIVAQPNIDDHWIVKEDGRTPAANQRIAAEIIHRLETGWLSGA